MEQQKQLISPAQIVSVEERQVNSDNYDKYYLILLSFKDENEEGDYRDWIKKLGRKETYEYLKDLVQNEPTLNLVDSKVLSNGNELGDEVSVPKFLRVMKDKFFKNDKEFDIDDYIDREEYWDDKYDLIPEE